MKNISNGLKAAIDAGEISYLFTILAADNTARRFTDHNVNLTVGGQVHIPTAGIGRMKMKTTNNAEVSNQEIAATIIDMPDGELKSGKWDNAQIEVAICSWRSPGEGKLIIFKGSLGVIQWTDEGFRADIQNYLRDLARNLGNTVTANCRHQLYSTSGPGKIGACGINRPAHTVNVAVDSVLTQRLKFKIGSSGKATAWASSGFVKFTSGDNAGLTYEVKKHLVEGGALGESIELYLPTIGLITPGTTIELSAGCDKTVATCKAKFNNITNFGGFPHLQIDVNLRTEIG